MPAQAQGGRGSLPPVPATFCRAFPLRALRPTAQGESPSSGALDDGSGTPLHDCEEIGERICLLCRHYRDLTGRPKMLLGVARCSACRRMRMPGRFARLFLQPCPFPVRPDSIRRPHEALLATGATDDNPRVSCSSSGFGFLLRFSRSAGPGAIARGDRGGGLPLPKNPSPVGMLPAVHYTGTNRENRTRDITIRSRIFNGCVCSRKTAS